MGDISKYFNRAEFACKDDCGFDDIDMELVKRLDAMREALGLPLVIDSGCRCAAHNATVGGEPNSAHLRGMAADVHCPDSNFRFLFTKEAYRMFFRMGQYKDWIHVDIDNTLPQFVMWFK